MSRFLFVIALILGGTGCTNNRPVTLLPGRSVVLGPSQAEAAVQQCSRAAPRIEGAWEPTQRDIEQLEADLGQIRRMRSEECCYSGAGVEDANEFYRQYVGVVIGGRRMIYVNAFPATEFDDWPSDVVPLPDWEAKAFIVCDGGSAYWGVIYDPERRHFSMLAFNGEV